MLSLAKFEYDNRLVHSRFTLEKQLSLLLSATSFDASQSTA